MRNGLRITPRDGDPPCEIALQSEETTARTLLSGFSFLDEVIRPLREVSQISSMHESHNGMSQTKPPSMPSHALIRIFHGVFKVNIHFIHNIHINPATDAFLHSASYNIDLTISNFYELDPADL